MIFPSNESWNEWGITEDCHKFFLVRWTEIFSEETFNTWQIKSSNILSLIAELIDVASVVESVPEANINLQIILSEIKDNLSTEIVIKEHFPFTNKYVEEIEKIYISEFGNNGNRSVKKLLRVCRVLYSNLKDYETKLIQKITHILKNKPADYKIELNQLTMSFAVNLFTKGYSIKSLQESTKILTNDSAVDFVARFEMLVDEFRGGDQDYECSFFVNWIGSHERVQFKDITIHSNRPREFSAVENSFYSQNKGSLIATVKVKTKDKFTARQIAEDRIESLSAMSQLYLVDKKTAIRNEQSLVKDFNSELTCIETDDTFLKYIHKAKNPETSIQELINLCENLSSSDFDHLHSSLQYHKLSLQSNSDELRLVNLWIAMESLFIGDEGSIIKKILSFVPKLNTTGYIYRQLRALTISMNKLWKETDTSNVLKYLKKSNKYKLDAFDFLNILLAEEKSNLLVNFIDIIKSNPVLIFRCERLWSESFGNPERLVKYLEKHRERVEWQIQRIYRTRNLIVHKGHCPDGSRLLIQHLHSYLIITIHTIVHDLKRNPSWNLNDALEHRVLLYEQFINRLKNYDRNKISARAII